MSKHYSVRKWDGTEWTGDQEYLSLQEANRIFDAQESGAIIDEWTGELIREKNFAHCDYLSEVGQARINNLFVGLDVPAA